MCRTICDPAPGRSLSGLVAESQEVRGHRSRRGWSRGPFLPDCVEYILRHSFCRLLAARHHPIFITDEPRWNGSPVLTMSTIHLRARPGSNRLSSWRHDTYTHSHKPLYKPCFYLQTPTSAVVFASAPGHDVACCSWHRHQPCPSYPQLTQHGVSTHPAVARVNDSDVETRERQDTSRALSRQSD
ncbi:hypothetical protein LZ31DRAFT_270797 [Colletotrichum somersetense]|nr:hypothetical protein LZ31DRAFT_270797 [Colletotrichum somersetense]